MNLKDESQHKIALAVHGGAGTILRSVMTAEKEAAYTSGLQAALSSGWKLLQESASALDAVEEAVRVLEDNALFNAGRGSVFTNAETHEMDAAIMSGENLTAGAVAAVSHIKNPIHLARKVLEHSEHMLLCGAGAETFAREMGVSFEGREYFFDEWRYNQLLEAKREERVRLDHSDDKKFGTVGAVALDGSGNLAAATSTGGMTNKRFGRIGDTPLIGAGTYANNQTCAVSCTGHGEFFIRALAAHDVSCLMLYKHFSLRQACEQVIYKTLPELGGQGGLIAVDANGQISMPFNTEGMYRGLISSDQELIVKIYDD